MLIISANFTLGGLHTGERKMPRLMLILQQLLLMKFCEKMVLQSYMYVTTYAFVLYGNHILIDPFDYQMAHGGTNFGFYNGANTGADETEYKPDLTSYDYVSNLLTHVFAPSIVNFGMHLSCWTDYLVSRMRQSRKLVMLTIQNSMV